MVAVVLLSLGAIVSHWAFVTAPTLKAAEQTKAELLISPYTQLLETALDMGDQQRLENILTQLILLEDPTYHEAIIVGLKVSLVDGQVVEKRNTVDARVTPFYAETPLFSPTSMNLLGSVKLEYNGAFYQRLIAEVWWKIAWSLAVALVLLLLVQRWVSKLLRPLSDLAGRLENVDFEEQVVLPTAGRNVSAEIKQVWHALEQLFARLKQRDEALEMEHAAAQSALKAKLEAESASREKSQFLANMSHELRTPLNAIIGYSEMLHEEAAEEKNQQLAKDLDRILSAGRHLLSLISSVLDLSKIEAGKMQLYLEDVSVPEMVKDIVSTLSPLVAENSNSLVVDCAEDVGLIHVDAVKLRQALINVIGNAAKFTHAGRITLSVERESQLDGDWMLFRVEDTGIGISYEQQQRLFRAFTQADDSTTRQYGGTGLGLTISRSMCRLMGGDITVSSYLGHGSEFVLKIPVHVEDPNVLKLERQAGAGEVKKTTIADRQMDMLSDGDESRRYTVLVIDEDHSIADVLQRSLSQQGFVVEYEPDSRRGWSRAKALMPDVIIMDVDMSDMDGWSVLSQLEKDPALGQVPVIVHSMVDERAAAFALGAEDYLVKPAEREQLIDVIKRHVGKQEELAS
jgi:signal transduction histidine kinase/ActR/RegA family two-component response regulator